MAAAAALAASAARPCLSVRLYAASGVVADRAALTRAARRLRSFGWGVTLDEGVRARHQRFAGTDESRLAALHRTAASGADIALAVRGGYGLGRLLDALDHRLLARSIDQGMRWVGHSDVTVLSLAILAHSGRVTWAGPMACADFGVAPDQGGIDPDTRDVFLEAMHDELEAVGFRTEAGFDGLDCRGCLWGGNLRMLTSLLGTRHWPTIRGGILFLEDVNEHPYRIERDLLQLAQAGVLERQKAILLGAFTDFRPSPLDRGYGMKSVLHHLRATLRVPVLTGLPFGHVRTKLTLPVGRRVRLVVQGREALVFL